MSTENSSGTVKSGEELPSAQENLEERCDIPSYKCTCVEGSKCGHCCQQAYKNAWRTFKNQLEKNAVCRTEILQRQKGTVDCMPDLKCGSDFQFNDKLSIKREVEHIVLGFNPYFSEKTEISDNLEQSNDSCDTSNICTCTKTKEAEISDNLERSNESCDTKSNIYADCPVSQEISEKPDTQAFSDSVSEICKRTRRSMKRKRDQEDSCPVCGLTIRFCELESHFAKEVENLSKIPKNVRKTRSQGNEVNTTFVQVKCNRENRLAAKVAKYTKKTVNEVYCPCCCVKLTGSEDEVNDHVLNCSEENFESDINVIDQDDSFEEYEFGDETRVRAISLVPGGYRALQGQSSKSNSAHEIDEDLNVDVDDTLTYGKPQYTELDVIHNLKDAAEVKELEQLRKAVLIDQTAEPRVLESRKWSNVSEDDFEEDDSGEAASCLEITEESKKLYKGESTENKNDPVNVVHDIVVSSLKEKIKILEDQSKSVKCLICLEPYTKPVVSTACWHVYCEECWLMTMGVKKLCPQCNMIVFPSDLRRIYL